MTFYANCQSNCFDEVFFDNFKEQIIHKLEKKAGDLERVEILIKQFKDLNYSRYSFAVEAITKNGIKCSDIKSLSLVETYSWHSLLHRTYVIAEISKDTYHVSLIDHFKNSTKYLGNIESNYLSQMAGYIIPRSELGVGDDYILTAQLYKSGHINTSIASNSDIFEMNQLFLVEKLLFDRE